MGDYPTAKELRTIRNWQGSFKDLWEYVKAIWWMPDWGIIEKTSRYPYKLQMHTGGWSGNEQIIYNFQKARHGLYWHNCVKWKRGGHYWFEITKEMWEFDYSKVVVQAVKEAAHEPS